MTNVYLLTTGSGADGDEWHVLGIYTNKQRANVAKSHHERARSRADGSMFSYEANIELWPLNPKNGDPFLVGLVP